MHDRLTGRTLSIATGHDLSLALVDEGRVLASRSTPMAKGHAEALVPAIAELMAPFGGAAFVCNRIVVETGPGSFTGLRVGLAAARALSIAWGAELLGVRSTQLVAAATQLSSSLLVALEAPRGQIWVEGFTGLDAASTLAPAALSPEDAGVAAGLFDAVRGTAMALQPAGAGRMAPDAAAIVALAPGHLGRAELLYVRAAHDHQTG